MNDGVVEIAVPVDVMREARSAVLGRIEQRRKKMKKMPRANYKYQDAERTIRRLEVFLSCIEQQVGDIRYREAA